MECSLSYNLPNSNEGLPERSGVDRKLKEINYLRFMSPQRQGNENFPQGSVQPPTGQHMGLAYEPWYALGNNPLLDL